METEADPNPYEPRSLSGKGTPGRRVRAESLAAFSGAALFAISYAVWFLRMSREEPHSGWLADASTILWFSTFVFVFLSNGWLIYRMSKFGWIGVWAAFWMVGSSAFVTLFLFSMIRFAAGLQ